MSWESYDEITKLMYKYHDCSNRARFEELGELFTHGTFQSVYPWSPEGHGMQQGAQEVTELYNAMVQLKDGLPRVHFILTNIMLDIDEEAGTASATSYYTVFKGDERSWKEYVGIDAQENEKNPIQIMSAGRYEDTFHRIDGRWWFNSRVAYADFTGDRSGHNKVDPVEYGKQVTSG